MNNGVNRVFSYFLRKCSSVASSSSSKTVQTTGYAYKHRDGRQVAKYGIYFDEGDGRNRLEEIYGKQMTHIAAKLYAIIEAIKLADKDVDLTIKTDYDIKKWDYMKKWADRDFRKYGRPDEKMPNADLLQELYNIIEEREKRIDLVYTEPPAGEKNPVTKLIIEDMYKNSKPYFSTRSLEEVKDSDAEDSSISVDDYREWPTVYTSGVLISSSKGFLSAGYSTVWPENKVIAASHQRLAMMPVTLFRAEMCAIILALEQAERHKLQKVLVVTDSPHFLRHWRKGWKTNKGEDVSNKFLYNRIYDLVWNRRMIVRFRYEKADDSSIWQTVKDKCQQAIMLPLSSADKSDYDKTTEEITTRKCHLVSAGEQVCRVRFFKKGTPFTNGLIWDKVNSEEPKRFIPAPPGKAVDIFLAILKQAAEENEKFIILRTDSVKLIKKIESWMPVWKRSGWRNSRKNITNVEKWQEVDQLLQDIRVYWEIMDPPLPEDIDELEKLAPKKRRKRLTVKEEESSDVILSRAEGVL